MLWFLTLFNGSVFAKVKASEKPKLFIIGDRDNFTGLKSFQKMFSQLADPKEQLVCEGLDHFWFGKEQLLYEAIRGWGAKQGLQL